MRFIFYYRICSLLPSISVRFTLGNRLIFRSPATPWLPLPTPRHGVVPARENVQIVVPGMVALMANASLAEEFEGVEAPGKVRAAHRWLAAKSDATAIDETVDMVLNGEEDR